MKVGDLVVIETRHNKQTLRPPWYGKTGIIVDHQPGPLTDWTLTSTAWHVLVNGNVRKISYLYLTVIREKSVIL